MQKETKLHDKEEILEAKVKNIATLMQAAYTAASKKIEPLSSTKTVNLKQAVSKPKGFAFSAQENDQEPTAKNTTTPKAPALWIALAKAKKENASKENHVCFAVFNCLKDYKDTQTDKQLQHALYNFYQLFTYLDLNSEKYKKLKNFNSEENLKQLTTQEKLAEAIGDFVPDVFQSAILAIQDFCNTIINTEQNELSKLIKDSLTPAQFSSLFLLLEQLIKNAMHIWGQDKATENSKQLLNKILAFIPKKINADKAVQVEQDTSKFLLERLETAQFSSPVLAAVYLDAIASIVLLTWNKEQLTENQPESTELLTEKGLRAISAVIFFAKKNKIDQSYYTKLVEILSNAILTKLSAPITKPPFTYDYTDEIYGLQLLLLVTNTLQKKSDKSLVTWCDAIMSCLFNKLPETTPFKRIIALLAWTAPEIYSKTNKACGNITEIIKSVTLNEFLALQTWADKSGDTGDSSVAMKQNNDNEKSPKQTNYLAKCVTKIMSKLSSQETNNTQQQDDEIVQHLKQILSKAPDRVFPRIKIPGSYRLFKSTENKQHNNSVPTAVVINNSNLAANRIDNIPLANHIQTGDCTLKTIKDQSPQLLSSEEEFLCMLNTQCESYLTDLRENLNSTTSRYACLEEGGNIKLLKEKLALLNKLLNKINIDKIKIIPTIMRAILQQASGTFFDKPSKYINSSYQVIAHQMAALLFLDSKSLLKDNKIEQLLNDALPVHSKFGWITFTDIEKGACWYTITPKGNAYFKHTNLPFGGLMQPEKIENGLAVKRITLNEHNTTMMQQNYFDCDLSTLANPSNFFVHKSSDDCSVVITNTIKRATGDFSAERLKLVGGDYFVPTHPLCAFIAALIQSYMQHASLSSEEKKFISQKVLRDSAEKMYDPMLFIGHILNTWKSHYSNNSNVSFYKDDYFQKTLQIIDAFMVVYSDEYLRFLENCGKKNLLAVAQELYSQKSEFNNNQAKESFSPFSSLLEIEKPKGNRTRTFAASELERPLTRNAHSSTNSIELEPIKSVDNKKMPVKTVVDNAEQGNYCLKNAITYKVHQFAKNYYNDYTVPTEAFIEELEVAAKINELETAAQEKLEAATKLNEEIAASKIKDLKTIAKEKLEAAAKLKEKIGHKKAQEIMQKHTDTFLGIFLQKFDTMSTEEMKVSITSIIKKTSPFEKLITRNRNLSNDYHQNQNHPTLKTFCRIARARFACQLIVPWSPEHQLATVYFLGRKQLLTNNVQELFKQAMELCEKATKSNKRQLSIFKLQPNESKSQSGTSAPQSGDATLCQFFIAVLTAYTSGTNRKYGEIINANILLTMQTITEPMILVVKLVAVLTSFHKQNTTIEVNDTGHIAAVLQIFHASMIYYSADYVKYIEDQKGASNLLKLAESLSPSKKTDNNIQYKDFSTTSNFSSSEKEERKSNSNTPN